MKYTVLVILTVLCFSFLAACGGGSSQKPDATVVAAAPKDAAVAVVPKDAPAKFCVLNGVTFADGTSLVNNCIIFTCVGGGLNSSGSPCSPDALIPAPVDAPVASDLPKAALAEAGSEASLSPDAGLGQDVSAIDAVGDLAAKLDTSSLRDTSSVIALDAGGAETIRDAPLAETPVVADVQPDSNPLTADAPVSPDTPPCPPSSNLSFCSETCVDGRFDPSHCGSCQHACAVGEYCSAGVCQTVPAVPTNGIIQCSGVYRDTQNDPRYCGECTNACRGDQDCAAGVCQCPGNLTECSGHCVDMLTNGAHCGSCGNACPQAQSCTDGACRCQSGTTLCGTTCVDYLHDPANCGGCGKVCAPGTVCTYDPAQYQLGIRCVTVCGGGTTKCSDNKCYNTQTDDANCGVCGQACRADQSCSAGSCQCRNGLTDCNGACTDIGTDSANCGGCGSPCPAGQSCVYKTAPSNKCQLVCTGGTTACGNSCRDLTSDPNNCNSCGNACSLGEYCINKVCDVKCPTGLTDCSQTCVDTTASNANCGGCGLACPADQSCSSGTCQCTGGKTKCGNNTCSDTTADPRNCGACGTVCPTGQTCQAGVCGCSGSTTKCGTACIDTASDRSNCGGCGTVCASRNKYVWTYGTCAASVCHGTYGICVVRTSNFYCYTGAGSNQKENISDGMLTMASSEVFATVGATLRTSMTMVVTFNHFADAGSANTTPFFRVVVGNTSQQFSLPYKTEGSNTISISVGPNTALSDIYFVLFAGDWGSTVQITSIAFQ